MSPLPLEEAVCPKGWRSVWLRASTSGGIRPNGTLVRDALDLEGLFQVQGNSLHLADRMENGRCPDPNVLAFDSSRTTWYHAVLGGCL